MKINKYFSVMLLAVLIVSAFSVGQVFAATDCFSDIGSLPTVFQEAICWMKDNGVTSGYPDGTYKPDGTVTRAQMALFMKNQAEVPPATGDIYVTQSLGTIMPVDGMGGTIGFQSDLAILKTPASGSKMFTMSLSVPSILFGKTTHLKGLEICYDGRNANATISDVWVQLYGNGIVDEVYDGTDRDDLACRQYMLPTAPLMPLHSNPTMTIAVNFTSNTGYIYINSITAILSPSTTTAP